MGFDRIIDTQEAAKINRKVSLG